MQQQKMPQLLDQGLVHKTRQENVHIYNLRRTLCRKIKASVFENEMPLSLTENEYNYVSGFYKKKIPHNSPDPVYILRQDSDDITPTEVAKLSKPEWDYFNTCYVFDPETQKYVPKPELTEPEEQWCAQNILKRNNLIGDDDKKQLAGILEKVNALEKQNAFIANLYANPRHPYFFEHKLDHVPGLLLLEASRQVGVAGFHLYGKVPTKGTCMMLTELAANFHNYVELDFPVNFVVQPHDVKLHKKGYWLAAKMDALIFQKGLKVAEVRVAGSCINQKTLNRIRARKVSHGEN